MRDKLRKVLNFEFIVTADWREKSRDTSDHAKAYLIADFQEVIRQHVATLGPELLCSYDTTVDRASLLLNHAREQKEKGQEVIIVHVRVGGDGGQARDANNYVSLPDSSPTSTADLCKTRVMITQLAGVLQSGEIGLSLSPSSLDPRPDEVVRSRPMISPFHDTDLARLLRDSKVKEVIIAGVATSGVVLGSAQSSIDHGLGVTVVKDACIDPDQDLHDVLMNYFSTRGKVLTVEEIIQNDS